MKKTQALVVSAALAIAMTAPASAGVNDPEIIIYRFAGVKDDGGANNLGVATVFQCTNFSGEGEHVRFVSRGVSGFLISNQFESIGHLGSVTSVTHVNAAYGATSSLIMNTSAMQGTVAIAATSINVICTAMTVDAANPKPDGVALRGIRFNPAPGSQE